MQLCIIAIIMACSLFGMTQGSPQVVYVLKVEKTASVQEYQCVTEPVDENTQYYWHKQDWSGLPEGVKAEDDRLHFLKATPDLNGLYICKAENRNGAATGSVYRHLLAVHSEL